MNIVGRVSVFPKLPDAIGRLQELAYNLWWSWTPAAQELFAAIDPTLWTATNHNPVKFLRNVDQAQVDRAAGDAAFLAAYAQVMAELDSYMAPEASSWFGNHRPAHHGTVTAYFSAEFGLHEALPIYSGGLGILSGDHCKEASDLGLPFVGVGFLYPQGYFTQHIDAAGMQQADYEKIDFAEVPALPALNKEGQEVLIHVDLPGRSVYAKVWRIQVGRIPLLLMDTDVERNAPQDRELSARLYGGDHEMRISQEVVLGIGGVRALRALGYQPAVWHMNEGHSAFLVLERIRELVQDQGLSFEEAVEVVRANSVFTTHTPVAAGNDAFAFELVEKFFCHYWEQLGINRDRFLSLARHELPWGPQFSMTVLALRLSAYHNGVSELHGAVSRQMWRGIWPGTPTDQVPISSITNGVHTKTWLAPELRQLYDLYLPPQWLEEVDDAHSWDAISQIPDAALWHSHTRCKRQMISLIRERVRRQYRQHGEGPARLDATRKLLDPEALTIGFARRFALYKRATLIFWDEERLQRLLNDPARPVQIIYSGKAHPADEPGKALIQQIYRLSQRPEFAGKILFVENYDMNIARHLIAGVDVWLNTPRRPYEASGTSGQKAAMSGIPNFSVLDGWWREAYDGRNGWSIGEEREYKESQTQDEADAFSLYTTLEEEILPLYYTRDAEGIPHGWLQRMRDSIRSCGPRFSMRRMVKEYVDRLYLPAPDSGVRYAADEFACARRMATWKQHIEAHWHHVNVRVSDFSPRQSLVSEPIQISAQVQSDRIAAQDMAVEIVAGLQTAEGELAHLQVIPMQPTRAENGELHFSGQLVPTHSGKVAVGVRVRPQSADLIHPYETGLSHWA